MENSKIFTIDRFDGKSSFTLWQRRVMDLLVQQGLSKVLKGKEQGKPENMTDANWEELEEKCVSTIRLCIADNIVNNVIDETSAAEIWSKLEKLYIAKSLTNKLHLKRKLYKLRMQEGGNLVEHMNIFNGILNQLSKVDVKFEDEDKALLLLTSLPDSYEIFVDSFLGGKDKITMEQAQEALVSLDIRKKEKAGESMGGEALLSQGESRRGRLIGKGGSQHGRSRSRARNLENIQCYKCKEYGHYKRDCPKEKGKKKVDDDNSSRSLVLSDGDVYAVTQENDAGSRDNWYLDSCCVTHVCSRKDYFDTLHEGMAGQLKLGDNSTVKVMGTGSVKIKISNGEVYTLEEVAYVPKMQRNLISLSILDSKGYAYKAEGGVLKVAHGSMVLMKGKLHRKLYRLEGSTVKTSKVGQNAYARKDSYPGKRVSFAEKATNGNMDGGKIVNPAGGEMDRWRSLSRVK